MSYIKKDFLLETWTSEKLYNNFAKNMPIFDYHCHLSEYQIFEDKEFEDIYEIWLKGDHYKWRLMRNYGISEEFITGNKTNKEKFLAYCKVLGTAFGNPLYHWSQLELKDYFNCELEINEKNAEAIWNMCNSYIKNNHLSPVKLIQKSNVKTIFTTNEIFDDVVVFNEINKKNLGFKVYPAFRADKIMNIEAEKYIDYLEKIDTIDDFDRLLDAIEEKLQKFIKAGCVASDTALEAIYPIYSKEEASEVFAKRLREEKLTEEEVIIFKGYLTYFLLKLYSKYEIRSELHIGAMRNNNTMMFEKLGLDSGYDSISDMNSIKNLKILMDTLNEDYSLPPMIIFNLNPKMNVEIMTLLGCFQDESLKGKIQFGPAWWFLDNKNYINKNLEDLSALGHIATNIGMLTDSRSFLSYARHHYFRRLLCNYFGKMMEKGEMSRDMELVGKVIQDISYNNAEKYFGNNINEEI